MEDPPRAVVMPMVVPVPLVRSLLRSGGLRSVFQPVVDLDTSTVVAHEALTRGPTGLTDPLALFAAARTEDLLTELDDACRTTAVRAALTQDRSPTTIFLNAEPEAFTTTASTGSWEELAELVAAGGPGLDVVLEITERDIPTRPATLLRTVDRIRELGWGIALDDVGVSSASLAFMPLLRPDVVKLDAALVQQRPSAETGQIMHAVNDYAERSGALVLAEGIETEQHLRTAQALGARLGQGWLFGRPTEHLEGAGAVMHLGDLFPDRCGSSVFPPPVLQASPSPSSPQVQTPFASLPADVVLRRASKALLMHLSTQLEEQAVRLGQTCILTSAFQHARHFTPATTRRYAQVAQHTGFVYAVGEAFAEVEVPGVHAGSLPAHDPLCREWDVAVIGPHFHAALLAREVDQDKGRDVDGDVKVDGEVDTGSGKPDLDRVFEYAVTYRYDTVVATVRALLMRVAEHSSTP